MPATIRRATQRIPAYGRYLDDKTRHAYHAAVDPDTCHAISRGLFVGNSVRVFLANVGKCCLVGVGNSGYNIHAISAVVHNSISFIAVHLEQKKNFVYTVGEYVSK